ncbi:MAG: site-specific DNA-methyltransferase [Selenomonadaceae bacterium]|nr:site-specific DNA-methyltransferase [Selenomonadaceae bacterium]
MIYNEACLEGMKKIADGSVDLTVTSPPYDNLRTYNGYCSAFNFEPTAQQLWRVTKLGGVVVWIVNDATINGSETGTSFRQALHFKDLGFNLHDTMIYQKAGMSYPEANRYYHNFEYMFVLSKGKPKTVNLLCDRENARRGQVSTHTERKPNGNLVRFKAKVKDLGVRFNVWRYHTGFEGDKMRYKHPATFPLKLAEDHIKTWSNEGDMLLDPFMGSGSTGVACMNLNRNFIGFEIHPEYFKTAQRRIEEALAKKRQELF